jgi:hypothetical protein
MAKVITITDLDGALLGVVRADPIDAGYGITVQAVPRKTPEQRHYIAEVPDGLIGKRGKGWRNSTKGPPTPSFRLMH